MATEQRSKAYKDMPKDRQAESFVLSKERKRGMCETGIKWSLSIKPVLVSNSRRKRKRQNNQERYRLRKQRTCTCNISSSRGSRLKDRITPSVL